jgi:hypothetical protein
MIHLPFGANLKRLNRVQSAALSRTTDDGDKKIGMVAFQ